MKNFNFGFIAILITLVFCSCTKDEIESEQQSITIDLNLSNKTDWQMADQILTLVNEHRASLGKGAITNDATYASAYATDHTLYMIDTHSVNHDDFETRSQALKQRGATSVAENVAYGYNSAEDVVNAWLLSPSHKAIIEGPYTDCGFGVLKAENGQYFFTQIFYKK